MGCCLGSYRSVLLLAIITLLPSYSDLAEAHESSRAAFEASRRVALAKAQEDAEQTSERVSEFAELSVELQDAESGKLLPGLIRVTNLETGKVVEISEEIHRELNWYSVAGRSVVKVPRAKLRVEAIHGIETQRTSEEIDLTERTEATLRFKLKRFYDPRDRGVVGGNTHLHLMKLSYEAAMRYLELVPKSDGLDVVFLSHLRRMPDERTYISNLIVEKSFDGGELAKLTEYGTVFGNGEEHRHNFESNSEGYGHVMLLNLKKLIRPISIGPGIMKSGTDGMPVQRGISEAREEGATVVWCHGRYGMEDVPNWVAGLLDAQNIFDGGSSGGYDGSFYKYLNLGMKVPFSTGTDWFMYDFSRVYVPIEGAVTVEKWLEQLAAGRSYITNGTFLEFEVDGRKIGQTISLDSPAKVNVRGLALGRNDFGSVELVFNGEVVHEVKSSDVEGSFAAEMNFDFSVTEPGWLALRIPRDVGKNELDNELFAHTSPVYVELAGEQVFQPQVARMLIKEIEQNMNKISEGGIFDPGEEETVLEVHRQGIVGLERLLDEPRTGE